MSEYTEVERPFLDQLEAQGWTVIDQGLGVPQEVTSSLRQHFRQTLLPGVFDEAVRAINTTADGHGRHSSSSMPPGVWNGCSAESRTLHLAWASRLGSCLSKRLAFSGRRANTTGDLPFHWK